MGNKDLISVIIPVYKTEAFLPGCIDSVLAQTHRALEIILVDDGSPDGSGTICDAYAARDPRVVVLHRKNGGLSDARNAGIDRATGQWLGFVDSDDRIERSMFASLLESALQAQAQMAVIGLQKVAEDGRILEVWKPQARTLDRAGTHRYFLSEGKGREYACNKLFRRELFESIRFPKDRLYEDTYTFYLLAEAAEKTVLCPEVGYDYLQRGGNISSGLDLDRQMDGLYARQEKEKFYEEHYKDLAPLAAADVLEGCCWLFYKWYQAGARREDPNYRVLLEAFRRTKKKPHPRTVMLRGAEALISLSPRLFGRCYRLYKERG